MRRVVVIAAAVTVALTVGVALGACGIINGLLWPDEIGDAQICAAVAARDAQAAQCPSTGEGEGEGGAGTGQSSACDASCIRKGRNQCPQEWATFLACLLDDKHGCGDLKPGAPSFCDAELTAYTSCAGIDLANGCNNNGGSNPCGSCAGGVCDGRCDIGEPQTCQDCAACTSCFGGTCNNTCENGENGACPDCQHPTECAQCNGSVCNNLCEGPAEAAGGCADCHLPDCGTCGGSQCDGQCNGGEGPPCPDCSGGAQCGGCDGALCDGKCAADELGNCDDCTGAACNVCKGAVCNGRCEGADGSACPDCVGGGAVCGSDVDCGTSELCDDFSPQLCPGEDCDPADHGPACRSRCTTSLDCTGGALCMNITGPGAGRRACEQARCHADGDCAGGACMGPSEMQRPPAASGGFCLQACDANACFNGGACTCNGALPRCATVFNNSTPVSFACTTAGQGTANAPCTFEGDCNAGFTCDSGICRQLCFTIGNACPSGTCQTFIASTGICR